MKIDYYYRNIFVPANVAVSAIRRAGIPVDLARLRSTASAWETKLKDLQTYVEGEAAKRGMVIKYSPAHSIDPKILGRFLFGANGIGLEAKGKTATGQPSTDDDSLQWYASLKVPRDDDHPVVRAVLKIRSYAKGLGTYAKAFEQTRRADGACHPHFKWNLRTPRLAAENPPVHQIPERADREVADAIKAWFVPRHTPPPTSEEWDPRKHGSCFRWDIAGAEAAWRAAALTYLECSKPDPVAWEYIRLGKDIHSKTASLVYNVPEGTYKKGSYERDQVAKNTFFAKQYGAGWSTVKSTLWAKGRILLEDQLAKDISSNFDKGYTGLVELYEIDKDKLGKTGYCYDGYGRRRWVGLPEGVRYVGMRDGKTWWEVGGATISSGDHLERKDYRRRSIWGQLEHNFHVQANTPTQGMNATDNLWMLALCYLGEYVELAVPPMWESKGIDFPEAKAWRLHEGSGPGGKPFLAWHNNTVHDSGWGDCAPGYLEAVAKLVYRRCRALPMDWRLKADVPYRVELSVGPNIAALKGYNSVAKQFGLEPLPD